jgi:signal transduction histidine kinase
MPSNKFWQMLGLADTSEMRSNFGGACRGAALVAALMYGFTALVTSGYSLWAQSQYLETYRPINIFAATMLPLLVLSLGWMAIDLGRFKNYFLLSPMMILIYLGVFAFKVDTLLLMASWSFMSVLFALTLERDKALFCYMLLALILLLAAVFGGFQSYDWMVFAGYFLTSFLSFWLCQLVLYTPVAAAEHVQQKAMLCLNLVIVCLAIFNYFENHPLASIQIAAIAVFLVISIFKKVKPGSELTTWSTLLVGNMLLVWTNMQDLEQLLSVTIFSIVLAYVALPSWLARVVIAVGLLLFINLLQLFDGNIDTSNLWRAIRAALAVWMVMEFFIWRRANKDGLENDQVLPMGALEANFFIRQFVQVFLFVILLFLSAVYLWLSPSYTLFQEELNGVRGERVASYFNETSSQSLDARWETFKVTFKKDKLGSVWLETVSGELLYGKKIVANLDDLVSYQITINGQPYTLQVIPSSDLETWLKAHQGILLSSFALFVLSIFFAWSWALNSLAGRRLATTNLLVQSSIDEHERLSAEATDLNLRRDVFISNMSHEMRTPLTGIVGTLSFIDETTDEKELAAMLPLLRDSLSRLERLVDDLLHLISFSQTSLELNESEFDLRLKLDSLLFYQEVKARAKGLAFNVDQSKLKHSRYIGDWQRITQVVDNLINNAIKFTDNGRIDVFIESDLEGIRVMVGDTGDGIDYDLQERIFEPFEQGDMGYSKRYQGAGLGLAICRDLTKLMHGRLWLESEPGHGSRFYLDVPLKALQN